jgi:hypothetical protein
MKTDVHFLITFRSFLLMMRNVSDKICTENQNTHFVFRFFFFENRAVYGIMWKNTVERGMPQVTIWRMRIECWIPKATNTLRLCNTHCSSTATMVTPTRLNLTLYVHCMFCLRPFKTKIFGFRGGDCTVFILRRGDGEQSVWNLLTALLKLLLGNRRSLRLSTTNLDNQSFIYQLTHKRVALKEY